MKRYHCCKRLVVARKTPAACGGAADQSKGFEATPGVDLSVHSDSRGFSKSFPALLFSTAPVRDSLEVLTSRIKLRELRRLACSSRARRRTKWALFVFSVFVAATVFVLQTSSPINIKKVQDVSGLQSELYHLLPIKVAELVYSRALRTDGETATMGEGHEGRRHGSVVSRTGIDKGNVQKHEKTNSRLGVSDPEPIKATSGVFRVVRKLVPHRIAESSRVMKCDEMNALKKLNRDIRKEVHKADCRYDKNGSTEKYETSGDETNLPIEGCFLNVASSAERYVEDSKRNRSGTMCLNRVRLEDFDHGRLADTKTASAEFLKPNVKQTPKGHETWETACCTLDNLCCSEKAIKISKYFYLQYYRLAATKDHDKRPNCLIENVCSRLVSSFKQHPMELTVLVVLSLTTHELLLYLLRILWNSPAGAV